MSYKKLVEKYETKALEFEKEQLAKLLFKIGELQATCKHENTHWIQEISKIGTISSYLVKRCYNCNSNLDKLEVPTSIARELVTQFDAIVEEYRKKQSEKK